MRKQKGKSFNVCKKTLFALPSPLLNCTHPKLTPSTFIFSKEEVIALAIILTCNTKLIE